MDKVIHSALPTIILLSIVWTILAVAFIFVRYQVKKENEEFSVNPDSEKDKLAFSKEIDDLAVYVSNLPRPKDVIRDYRNEELENGNE